MDAEIKITAHVEPARPDTCRLVVDRPVYAEGAARFPNREAAAGSPLAERLFALGSVTAVRIAGPEVTVTEAGAPDWRVEAKQVAEAIRNHLRSGQPAVAPDFAARRPADETLRAQVEELFTTRVNPAIASHGGYVELVDVKRGDVYIRMGGGCQGCAMSMATLRQGIEKALRDAIPNAGELVDVTDHAAGDTPYYTS